MEWGDRLKRAWKKTAEAVSPCATTVSTALKRGANETGEGRPGMAHRRTNGAPRKHPLFAIFANFCDHPEIQTSACSARQTRGTTGQTVGERPWASSRTSLFRDLVTFAAPPPRPPPRSGATAG
jgi:hypothetical protein